MSMIQELAKSHIKEYQEKIGIDGWNDDICQEILVSFSNKIVEECAKYVEDEREIRPTSTVILDCMNRLLYEVANSLRREKVRL